MRYIIIITALFLVVISASCSQTQLYPKIVKCEPSDSKPLIDPVEGIIAPNVTWVDKEGTTHKLTDYRGKPTILLFWSKNCPSCVYDMTYLQNIYTDNMNRFEIIAINLTDPDSAVSEIVKKNNYSFPIIMDPEYKAQKCYNVLYTTVGLPWVFFIDSTGAVTNRWIGPFKDKEQEVASIINKF